MHRTTAERWRKRHLCGGPLSRARGPGRNIPDPTTRHEAVRLVQDTHGLIGASALSHCLDGLSRRVAADIKQHAVRRMEIERRARTQRVIISSPGVLRGFDGMHLGSGRGHLLVAADGCVPYRTSWSVTPRHDERAVATLLERDFERHGPPLVLRLDRAAEHDAPAVRDLLRAHAVLPLHGAPYHARYYGQLERQNREHRAWIVYIEEGVLDVEAMMTVLNGRWRRSTLGWSTASEVWAARPAIDIDRHELADDVRARAGRLQAHLACGAWPRDLAWRLALKSALTTRGLLRIETGGWC